jgi:hypothetical protein
MENEVSTFQSGPYNQQLHKFGLIRAFAEKIIDRQK